MSHGASRASRKRTFRPLALLVLVPLLAALLVFARAQAGDLLLQRGIVMSTAGPGETARYALSFTLPTSETLGSIKLEFCENDPLFTDPCVAPNGLDASAAVLSAQSGATGFGVSGAGSDGHTLVLTRTAGSAAGAVSYSFDGIINPTTTGTFYARLQTFASTDASGAENEHGGIALATSNTLQISTKVPPYLLFCLGITITGYDCDTASGSYINFGNLSSSTASSADTEMVLATNADTGYALTVQGSTLTSGNNVITPLTSADLSRPGLAQFGINLVANTTPAVGADPQGPGSASVAPGYNQTDWFRFVPGDTVAGVSGSDDLRKFTTSYVTNIPQGQPIGVYVATLTYVCLANF